MHDSGRSLLIRSCNGLNSARNHAMDSGEEAAIMKKRRNPGSGHLISQHPQSMATQTSVTQQESVHSGGFKPTLSPRGTRSSRTVVLAA